MAFIKSFTRELFEPERQETTGEILFFRLFELFIIAFVIKYAWQWGFYMGGLTDVVLPLGLANYIDISFLFDHSLALFNAGLITFTVLLSFFRIGFRWQYLLALALLHFQHVGRYSQGDIDHSSNLIGMSLLCVAVGFIFFKTMRKKRRFIIGSIIFFVGLSYTSAAFSKLIGSGITWSNGNHMWLLMAEKKIDILSRTGSFSYNWLQQLAFNSWYIATAILTFGWIVEFSGILICWKRLRPYIATALICFHIGITMTMNIRFDVFIYELILLGYPWASLIDRYNLYIPTKLKIGDKIFDYS